MLLAAVVYAVAVVAQKVVLRRIPGLQVTWLAALIGTVACLPFTPSLITDVGNASAGATLGMHLSRPGADRGGLPDLGLRAGPQRRRAAGRHHLRGAADRHRRSGWIFLDEVPALLAVIGGAISLIGVAIARRPAKRPAGVPSN